MKKAVFLDRDGTVINDCGYLDNVEGVALLDGAGEGMQALAAQGFVLVLITNQSGIGRGMFDEQMVHRQNARLIEILRPYNVEIAAVRICPHTPEDDCGCRKPNPGMLLSAAEELGVDFSRSWMLGDKRSDMQAGKAAGCRTILFRDEPMDEADFYAEDMPEAARIIRILDH